MIHIKQLNITLDYQPNLKHWGDNIWYSDTIYHVPILRFYALFIYFGTPLEID